MSDSPFAPGLVLSGWTVGAPEVRGPSPRWSAERDDGQKGTLSYFPFSGPRGVPHQRMGRTIVRWKDVKVAELAPIVTGSVDGDHKGIYVIVPQLTRIETRAPVDAILALKSAATALAALHEQGIVHGELDFWCVQRTADGAKVVLLPPALRIPPAGVDKLGLDCDPRYAAPEVLDRRPATPASDAFSLGLVLYRLLTGRAPVPGSHPGETFIARGKMPVPDLPADVPPPIKALYVKMTSLLPEQRPADARALLADIALVEKGRAPARPSLPKVKVEVERAGGAIALLLLVLALGAGAFGYAVRVLPPQDPTGEYVMVLPRQEEGETTGPSSPDEEAPDEEAPDEEAPPADGSGEAQPGD